jgi:hypothetical protein
MVSSPAVFPPRADHLVAPRLVARAATAVLLAAVALAAQVPARFALGDSRERVRQVQGSPDVIERLPSLGAEVWSYGNSTVKFDPRTGHVVEYIDGDRRLKVSVAPRTKQPPGPPPIAARAPITLGATRDEVLRAYGVPWAYTRDANARHHFLAYGRSIVRLIADDDRVDGWIVRDSSIRVAGSQLAEGEAAMGIVRANGSTRVAIAPATLRGRVQWRDADGDGVLAPGEAAIVTLTLDNDGPGVARAVRGMLRVESPATGLEATAAPPVTIAAGQSRDIVLRLTADSAQASTEIVAIARASEANGFDLAPALRLRIPARAAGAPRLVVQDTRIDDASRDGRLAPREIADLTIRVANTGTAATPPLRARLWRGADLFLAAGARDTFSLGALPAGEVATVSVSVYTNSRAADTALRLELADASGRVLARLPIALPLTGQPSGVLDVVASHDSGVGGGRRAVLRSVDVERDLPHAAARRRDAIAVILGVDRYRALPVARFAERDAALMRRYAVEALGINDDVEHLYLRTGADVTGGEMRKLFGETGWLARRVTANTDLVVYFAGHGAPDASRRAPYLLPFDADPAFVTETGFALGTLYDRLARLPARSITVILDACFTGATRDGVALVRGARPTVLSIEHPALLRRQMSVITASRDAEVAGDLPEARHGLLTYWIARGLRGEADADGDAAITVAELGRFVEFGVRQTAARQDREQRPLTIARDSLVVLSRLAPPR